MASNLIERVHTNVFLTDLALRFPTPQLLADKLAPRLNVAKQSNKYRKFGKDGMYQYESTWAPGAIPNAITTEFSEDTYFAQIRKLRHQLLDAELNNVDANASLDLRTLYTERVTLGMRIAREARIAALFTTAANYPGANVITKTGGSEWDAGGVINTVQPITDLEVLIQQVMATSMVDRSALTVVIPAMVMAKAIRNNSAIRDYYKYTMQGVTTEQILAQLLGVEEVLIAQGQVVAAGPQNAALDIITGITTTYLWGDNVWVGVVEDGATGEYSFARTFQWSTETNGQDLEIREYPMADLGQEGQWIEAKEALDEKITANFAGGLLVNALS